MAHTAFTHKGDGDNDFDKHYLKISQVDNHKMSSTSIGSDFDYARRCEQSYTSSDSAWSTTSESEDDGNDCQYSTSIGNENRDNESQHKYEQKRANHSVPGDNKNGSSGKSNRKKSINDNTPDPLTTGRVEEDEDEGTTDESIYCNDLLGYDLSDRSESVDLSELDNLREDIVSPDHNPMDSRNDDIESDSTNSDHDENEQERWDRISRNVERMKLLLMKYPKFTSRVGNNNIISALHTMMDTLEERKSPTSEDIKMVEDQMENFKSILFAEIEEDVLKWKAQRRGFKFYVMRCFSMIAIMAAVVSVVFKFNS